MGYRIICTTHRAENRINRNRADGGFFITTALGRTVSDACFNNQLHIEFCIRAQGSDMLIGINNLNVAVHNNIAGLNLTRTLMRQRNRFRAV